MNKFLSLVSMSILAAPALLAADEKPAPIALKNKSGNEPASIELKNKAPEEPGAFVLKNKSSFKIDAAARSPFWPISWKPAGKISTGGTDQGEVPPGAFLVSTITLDGGTRFAIINGKSMQEGQQFGLQIGTQVYQVTVKRIEDGRVILSRHDGEIIVPLRRK